MEPLQINAISFDTAAGDGEDDSDEKYERRRSIRDCTYFTKDVNDRKSRKRIDYVLVYDKKSTENASLNAMRKSFEEKLQSKGMLLEREDIDDSSDKKSYFVKLHCPWELLCKGATLLKMRKRLKLSSDLRNHIDRQTQGISCNVWACVTPDTNVIGDEPEEFFTMVFDSSRIDLFDLQDEETFFTNAERSLIAKLLLDRTKFSDEEHGKMTITKVPTVHIGIQHLLQKGVYTAAFPLHDSSMIATTNDPVTYEGEDKDRLRLYQAWARPKNLFMIQPLDLIRKYFGEKVGLYFAWMGIYTWMLIPASLFGFGCFLYGLGTLPTSGSSNDVCDANGIGATLMCPACDRWCNYTLLKESCFYARITHVFDNRATIAMAIFMSAWALVFLDVWKRKQVTLQYDWDVDDYELDETIRPQFHEKIQTKMMNPVTKIEEPYLPGHNWCLRRGTSLSITLFLVAVVLAAIFGVLVYRLAVVAALFATDSAALRAGAKLITSITSSVINLIACLILGRLYGIIAKKLTDLDAHRTQTAYEDSYTMKMIIFQFINFYGFIFYIAFFKGSFIDRPGQNSMYVFGKYREDACDPAGCIIELTIQLAVVMIGKQLINAVQELLVPLLMTWFNKRDILNKQIYMRWEQDNDLVPTTTLTLFDEYLAMVIQFGFVTLFVTSFPLAPLCALINNMVEIRLDAYKFTKLYRRPPAVKAQDIGAWFSILKFLAYLSVVTNGFIIAWTSDLVPKMYYSSVYKSSEGGYTNFTLTSFNVSDFIPGQAPDKSFGVSNVTVCWYRDVRYGHDSPNKYEYTPDYWAIFCARLAFVIVFEHATILIMLLAAAAIPDQPGRVKRLRTVERELTRTIMFKEQFGGPGSLLSHLGEAIVNGVNGEDNAGFVGSSEVQS